ncbi:hypothetical protein CPB84DRAFT_699370 [Gymnopilus junonius]|uniref:Uncharacterized protein n=1 Tax=Gymnopilus junonius TaxID=109634 RepID=A0A9P5NPB8_GYMJU|nr:hypothetical protein CPB84DRAFT_699370 [Gymnopilus junonius]
MSSSSGISIKDAKYKINQRVKLAEATLGSKRGANNVVVEKGVSVDKGETVQISDIQKVNKPRGSIANGVVTPADVIFFYRVTKELNTSYYTDVYEAVEGLCRLTHQALAESLSGEPDAVNFYKTGDILFYIKKNSIEYKTKGGVKHLGRADRVMLTSDAATFKGCAPGSVGQAFYDFKVVKRGAFKHIWKSDDYLEVGKLERN